mgnify:CR=1 FL=1
MMNSKLNVLLIEDETQYAYMLQKRFAKNMKPIFDVSHAGDLQKGLGHLARGGVDVALLDLSLPDSQGIDTFLSVQAQAPGVPVVVLTALDDESLGLEAVKGGAQDYLVKGRVEGKELPRILLYAVARHKKHAELRTLSLADELTGLRNRRGFTFLAEQQLKLAQRTKKGLLLFFMDVDEMKYINDTFGHKEGDRALMRMAEVLKETFRQSDVLARMGGDEFAVLAIEASRGNAKMLEARLKENLKKSNQGKNIPAKLSLSVGAAYFDPEKSSTLEDLIAQADQAMYQSKRNRKIMMHLL